MSIRMWKKRKETACILVAALFVGLLGMAPQRSEADETGSADQKGAEYHTISIDTDKLKTTTTTCEVQLSGVETPSAESAIMGGAETPDPVNKNKQAKVAVSQDGKTADVSVTLAEPNENWAKEVTVVADGKVQEEKAKVEEKTAVFQVSIPEVVPTESPVASTEPTVQPPTEEPPTVQPPTEKPPTMQPPTEEPPTIQPPTEEPPTVQPPTAEPPTIQPPTEEPPTVQPPTEEPPTMQPPTEEPPTAGPPTVQPPTAGPPTIQPPTAEPPTVQPPTAEPPTIQPPTEEPPTVQPPTAEPPTMQPPTAEPPTIQPPTEEPPTIQPPTEEPPTMQPPTEPTPQPPIPTQPVPSKEPDVFKTNYSVYVGVTVTVRFGTEKLDSLKAANAASKKIVKISKNKVTGLRAGTAKLIAVYRNKTYTIMVKVPKPSVSLKAVIDEKRTLKYSKRYNKKLKVYNVKPVYKNVNQKQVKNCAVTYKFKGRKYKINVNKMSSYDYILKKLKCQVTVKMKNGIPSVTAKKIKIRF